MISETVKKSRAYFCLDCGKCTAVCPIARFNHKYSPRRLVAKAVSSSDENASHDKSIWTCLTCGLCQLRCPMDINYIEFTKLLRQTAKKEGEQAKCSHGGVVQSLSKIMTAPKLAQKRLDWLTSDFKISNNSEFLYFVGCLPYYDALFSNIQASSLDIARSTVKILNFFGIKPTVLADERCCGHDLLWTGDIENFKKLAQHNLSQIKKTKVKKIITSCPECLNTLRIDYPQILDDFKFEVIHTSEFIAENLSSKKLNLKSIKKKITYQDPCRLGRFLEIYEQPRQVLSSIPEIQFQEMPKNRKNAICCGTSSWMNCDMYSKMIQTDRLKQAKDAGAEILITACPKCQIHFKCTQSDENYPKEDKLEIVDLVSLFSEAITE